MTVSQRHTQAYFFFFSCCRGWPTWPGIMFFFLFVYPGIIQRLPFGMLTNQSTTVDWLERWKTKLYCWERVFGMLSTGKTDLRRDKTKLPLSCLRGVRGGAVSAVSYIRKSMHSYWASGVQLWYLAMKQQTVFNQERSHSDWKRPSSDLFDLVVHIRLCMRPVSDISDLTFTAGKLLNNKKGHLHNRPLSQLMQ